jgi:hypothetical protein
MFKIKMVEVEGFAPSSNITADSLVFQIGHIVSFEDTICSLELTKS